MSVKKIKNYLTLAFINFAGAIKIKNSCSGSNANRTANSLVYLLIDNYNKSIFVMRIRELVDSATNAYSSARVLNSQGHLAMISFISLICANFFYIERALFFLAHIDILSLFQAVFIEYCRENCLMQPSLSTT